MRSDVRASSYWMVLLGSYAGAVIFAVCAFILILQLLHGHGSAAGNILRFTLALVAIFLGFFLVAVGTVYRLSFNDDSGNEFR
ncbi:MAG TPA: hypothetical protein VKT71_01680 [Candidatus Acidoferrales bacterium]|nr:hypothetical protein [Candidatus Acidoferrales bacterium]